MTALLCVAFTVALQPSSAAFKRAQNRFNKALDDEMDAALAPLLVDSKEVTPSSTPIIQAAAAPRQVQDTRVGPRESKAQRRKTSQNQQRKPPSNRAMTIAERMDSDADAALAPVLFEDEDETSDEMEREIAEDRKSPLFQKRSGPELAAEWLIRKYEDSFGEVEIDQRRRGQ